MEEEERVGEGKELEVEKVEEEEKVKHVEELFIFGLQVSSPMFCSFVSKE